MKPMNPRPIFYNYFEDFIEAKHYSTDTTLSRFPAQEYTNPLSHLVPWFTSLSGAVPFAFTFASYEVLTFTNFKFITIIFLTQKISCIFHLVFGLWSICKYCGRPRLIQFPPNLYHLLNISYTHSLSEVKKLSSLCLLKFSMWWLIKYHYQFSTFISSGLRFWCLEHCMNEHR